MYSRIAFTHKTVLIKTYSVGPTKNMIPFKKYINLHKYKSSFKITLPLLCKEYLKANLFAQQQQQPYLFQKQNMLCNFLKNHYTYLLKYRFTLFFKYFYIFLLDVMYTYIFVVITPQHHLFTRKKPD